MYRLLFEGKEENGKYISTLTKYADQIEVDNCESAIKFKIRTGPIMAIIYNDIKFEKLNIVDKEIFDELVKARLKYPKSEIFEDLISSKISKKRIYRKISKELMIVLTI